MKLKLHAPIFAAAYLLFALQLNSQITSATYDFESLTTGAYLNGQDNWEVLGEGVNQNVSTSTTSGDYTGSKAFLPGSLGGNNQILASRVNDGNWSFPDITTCSETSELILECTMYLNYWGQAFFLGYDANDDGDFGSADVFDANELSIGFGRKRSGSNYMRVYKADGSYQQVVVAESLSGWVRYRLTVNLLGNSGSGSGTLYYKDLANSGAWTEYPGLSGIDMLIDSNSANQDNLSNLDGMAIFQDADSTGWDDIFVQTTCTDLLATEAAAFEKLSIYPNPSNGTVSVDKGSLNDLVFELKNSLGQRLLVKELKGAGVSTIELNQAPGVYIATLQSENAIKSYKIVIE